MIDFKVSVLGEKEIARQLEEAGSEIRAAVREELAAVGDEIVSRAQAMAPKRTGVMASKVLWYFGLERTARQMRKLGGGATRTRTAGRSSSPCAQLVLSRI